MLGRRLKQWAWGTLPAGSHDVAWDGRADDGRTIEAGILFYRLEAGGRTVQQKMVRLRN